MLNTTPESTPEAPAFRALDDTPLPEARDQALAALEKQLQASQDAHKEERFVWIVVCTLLLDILWLRTSENAALPVIVLILELVILLVLARRMGIEDIERLMDRIIHSVGQKGTGG